MRRYLILARACQDAAFKIGGSRRPASGRIARAPRASAEVEVVVSSGAGARPDRCRQNAAAPTIRTRHFPRRGPPAQTTVATSKPQQMARPTGLRPVSPFELVRLNQRKQLAPGYHGFISSETAPAALSSCTAETLPARAKVSVASVIASNYSFTRTIRIKEFFRGSLDSR